MGYTVMRSSDVTVTPDAELEVYSAHLRHAEEERTKFGQKFDSGLACFIVQWGFEGNAHEVQKQEL